MGSSARRWLMVAVAVAAGTQFLAAQADEAQSRRPTVVELFTSQGCYSCPPAEAFLRELADRPDIIALEFHVDYWDELVYGAAGKWKDPFSSPMATARQRQYAAALGTGRVYTPQMVVEGRLEGVGSHRSTILAAIERVRGSAEAGPVLALEATGAGLRIALESSEGQAGSLLLVLYDRTRTTEVRAGENQGKQLTSRNIVRGLRHLADWQGESLELVVGAATLAEAEDCAVLVQSARHGPILQAARCPAGMT